MKLINKILNVIMASLIPVGIVCFFLLLHWAIKPSAEEIREMKHLEVAEKITNQVAERYKERFGEPQTDIETCNFIYVVYGVGLCNL